VEIGSGNSTRFARWASDALGLETRIVSIDPEPRIDIDGLCDERVRLPLESADLAAFNNLTAGDIVFCDSSHRAFANSDVTTFFLDVLPRLGPGTVWGLHDICSPNDYMPIFAERCYNEQYMLEVYMLGGGGGDRLLWGSHHIHINADHLLEPLSPLLSHRPSIDTFGGCVWFQRAKARR